MELLIEIDRSSTEPIFIQIASKIKAIIDESNVPAGTQLPSSRTLSETLGVSRFTTVRAYEELQRCGYVRTYHAKGTFVTKLSIDTKSEKDNNKIPVRQLPLSDYGKRIMLSPNIEDTELIHPELNYSAPAPERLPLATWKKLISSACKTADNEIEYVIDSFGHRRLRQELSKYLARARGLNCSADQICLFSGAQPGLDMLCRVLLNAGDQTAVENPGFPGARRTFASFGANVQAISMDDRGMKVSDLKLMETIPKIIYVTPSHHDPTGVTMSAERRKDLLDWAYHNKVLIVEDDFDGDYRYGDISTPPLKAHDQHESVIYLSSFWKVLFPVFSIGFIVLPSYLIPVIEQARALVENHFFFIEHEALATFIQNGSLERHIRKTRTIYSHRRKELVTRLNINLGSLVQISPSSAGTHLLIRFSEDIDPEDIVESASSAGLSMLSTGPFYAEQQGVEKPEQEFLIPFAHVDETTIVKAVEAFASKISKKSRVN